MRPGSAGARGARHRRPVVRGIAAIVLASALLSCLHAFATPPFAPPDETSHVAYALAITEGRRPLVTDFPDATRVPLMREGLSVWTANHPPLHHLLAGVPLRLGEATGFGLAGFFAARLVSVLAHAVGVALVGWLLLLLVPGRPALAVSAAGIAGPVPHFLNVAGIAYNDATAFLFTTATLLAGACILLRGPSRLRVGLLAAAATAAAATRVSGLLPLALAGAAAGVAPLLHPGGTLAARLRRGALSGAVVATAALAVAGVFYVQNVMRYGGLTATATLMTLFEREPRGAPFMRLVWRGFWRDIHTQWWSRINESSQLPDALLIPFRWWAPAIAVGLLVVALRALTRGTWRLPPPRLAAWALPLGLLAGTILTFSLFVARGGSAHARYLFPALAAVAALAAVGLGALPGARRGLPAAACTLSLLVAATVTLYRFALDPDVDGAVLALKRLALDGGTGFVLVAIGVVALLAASFAVYATALWQLGPVSAPGGTAAPGAPGTGPPGEHRPVWRRDPAGATLAGLIVVVTGAWVAAWYLPGLPAVAGALAGLVLGPGALVAAERVERGPLGVRGRGSG